MSNDTTAKIKTWYADLPEITLPNLDSEDGTYMEVNLPELAKFIDQLLTQARLAENLACSQIMDTYWKTSEMVEAASKRRDRLNMGDIKL